MPSISAAPPVLVDSGPLVALFNRRDSWHPKALQWLQACTAPLVTNLGVITEVFHLLGTRGASPIQFLEWIDRGPLAIEPVSKTDFSELHRLMTKYADVPMDLADGMLVVQAVRLGIDRIATVDSDFTVYRMKKRKPFVNVFPLHR